MNRLVKAVTVLSKPKTNQFVLTRFYTATGINERIEKIVNDKKIVVFMKGTPDAPRCGFSKAVMQILDFHGVSDFNAHDVLDDDEIREGIVI